MTTTTATHEIIGFRVLGITDERDTCDCCGRTGLKATVAIAFDDEPETMFYGRTCAARYARVKVSVIDRRVREAEQAKRDAEHAARQAQADAEDAAYAAWLTAKVGPGARIEQLRRYPGGTRAALDAFYAEHRAGA